MKNKAAFHLALSTVSPFLASVVICLVLLPIMGQLLKSEFGVTVIQLVLLAIFVLLLFFPFYRKGIEDSKLAADNEMQPDLTKGLRAGMMLSLLLYPSVILLILMKLQFLPDMVYLYKILNPQFTGITHYLIPNNTIDDVQFPQFIYAILLPLIVPVVAGSAYYTGSKSRK